MSNCTCASVFYRGPVVRRAKGTVQQILGVSFYECIRCGDRYIKNDMISGNPVTHAAGPLAQAWLAGYKSREEHEAAIKAAKEQGKIP